MPSHRMRRATHGHPCSNLGLKDSEQWCFNRYCYGERQTKPARKVEDNRTCMFLKELRQSIRFCWLHCLGFCLKYATSFRNAGNEFLFHKEQGESLFLLTNLPILPGSLGKGRMLLCSDSSEHKRAIKISVNKCYSLFNTGNKTVWSFQTSAAFCSSSLPFKRYFGVHLAWRMQR